MAHHDSNGHGSSHDHDNTEGSRQYYSKGWYLPLIGLVVIALGFSLLGGFVLGHSGTDKWGKKAECTEECMKECKESGKECNDKECKDMKECKDHEGDHGDVKHEEVPTHEAPEGKMVPNADTAKH